MVNNKVSRPHPVTLRGLQQSAVKLSGARPTLLKRLDTDPIAGLLADLQKTDLSAIARTQVTVNPTNAADFNPWAFYQPIHRVFHVVLLEAVCDPYGNNNFQPRLDPQKIESAGLVIRRETKDEKGTVGVEGWRTLTATSTTSTAKIEGWRALSSDHAAQDPDQPQTIGYTPAVKTSPAQALAGAQFTLHPTQIATLKDAIETAYTEHTTPLFIAPPDVCDRHNKTILYGLVPLTSSAISQSQNADTAFDIDFIKSHLNPFLRANSEIPAVPFAGARLNGITAARYSQENEDFRVFLSLLRQLAVEFEFNKADPDTNVLPSRSRVILKTLNRITLRYGSDTNPAGNALRDTAKILLDPQGTESITLPTHWGNISTAIETALASQVKAILDQRLGVSTPQLRQFDEPDRSYQVSAFIRVRQPDGCPDKIHWSLPSQSFTIRPWYDNSPAPPVQVPLPDLLGDRTLLKKLKPNVAFGVPASLFDSIEGMTLQDLLDGKKPASGGLGIGWICGFNIPIITICAFIVLNIFLVLLNFIFGWLPFIKICVPIPQRSQGGN
ncbi:MAG: hypothetical protein AAF773_26465 [Cyanobacteria bacterium P01_D01_bin.115]